VESGTTTQTVAAPHDPRASPRSPTRTLRIREIIAESPQGMSLAQLSQRLAIPKTSLFVPLRPLVAQGYLMPQAGRYHLGPSTLRLSIRASRSSYFLRAVRPTLESYAARPRKTIAFVMLDESETAIEYMDVLECTKPIRYFVAPGEKCPVYCPPPACEPAEAAARYLDAVEIKQMTAATIVDRQKILERLQTIRREGVIATVEECTDEVSGFAAPVFAKPRHSSGALAVSAPMSRAFRSKEDYVPLVRQAAHDASSQLVGGAVRAQADAGRIN
jgi:DNA-binding IclR family transcriptional regulator